MLRIIIIPGTEIKFDVHCLTMNWCGEKKFQRIVDVVVDLTLEEWMG